MNAPAILSSNLTGQTQCLGLEILRLADPKISLAPALAMRLDRARAAYAYVVFMIAAFVLLGWLPFLAVLVVR